MQKRTQADIVNQHLQSLQVGETIEEKLAYPFLDKLFVVDRKSDEPATSETKAKLPVAANMIGHTTKVELSDAIAYCAQYRPGQVAGLSWNVGDDFVTVKIEQDSSIELADGRTEDDLKDIILNILRSRAAVQGFEWNFGETFVTVRYENRQFA